MERHPLVFLSVLIALGMLQGSCIGLLLIINKQLSEQVTIARNILAELTYNQKD